MFLHRDVHDETKQTTENVAGIRSGRILRFACQPDTVKACFEKKKVSFLRGLTTQRLHDSWSKSQDSLENPGNLFAVLAASETVRLKEIHTQNYTESHLIFLSVTRTC